ncbi:MAG: Double zinc ribbon [Chloroflexi bacterium ADurb.Bin360]|nr:HEAT repeat domain-containing protein [Anaerolineae bacterium]OQA22016.1 MAG: Double zinc ribbon [Chloroflexi bacterium ADurb.Bin360]
MTRRYCPACWADAPATATRCPNCGKPLDDGETDLVLRYATALRHREPTRACLACGMLAELGDLRAVPPLLALVESRPQAYEVLVAAAESLAALQDARAVPVLQALLEDTEAVIPARLAALRALTRFGGEAARAALAWARTCDRPSLQTEALALDLGDSLPFD